MTKNEWLSDTKGEFKDKLGQYITEEYGLLKQILCNLNTKDLVSAREVCRSWAKVVEVILAESNKPVCGYIVNKQNDGWSQGAHLQVLPKVIFYSMSSGLKKHHDCRNLATCPCKHGNTSTELIVMRNQSVVVKQMTSSLLSGYDFMYNYICMLFLPSMPGVEINAVGINQKLDHKLSEETINQLIGNRPIKCLLLFTHKISSCGRLWVSSFVNKLIDRQGSPMAIGGGDSLELGLYRRTKENCKAENCSLFIVAIRGGNVTAHSELLQDTSKKGIEDFMIQMSKNVGPVPSGSKRLAFIVKCVNRCYLWDRRPENIFYEGSKFKEALPGVPQYGFVGFGEYGLNTEACDCPKGKKMKGYQQIIHSNTTSFVILTIHNVQQRQAL